MQTTESLRENCVKAGTQHMMCSRLLSKTPCECIMAMTFNCMTTDKQFCKDTTVVQAGNDIRGDESALLHNIADNILGPRRAFFYLFNSHKIPVLQARRSRYNYFDISQYHIV